MKGINLARAVFISIPNAARPLCFVLDFNHQDDSTDLSRHLITRDLGSPDGRKRFKFLFS